MYHHTEADFNTSSSAKSPIVNIIDEQTIAQAELSAYIDQQAQEIAPEPQIQFIDLDGFYTYEAQTEGKTIATITHDCEDFVTQPWVVMVGETEVHRADTWAKCANYIQWHYKQGTLPTEVIELEAYKLVYVGGESPLGYKVYKADVLRGMIWQHLTHWSNGIDRTQHTEPLAAAVALDELIDLDEDLSLEELLDKPFDELSTLDWQRLKEYEPHNSAVKVAA